jgi:hypothetical protein
LRKPCLYPRLSQTRKEAKNGVAGVRSTPATPFFALFLLF